MFLVIRTTYAIYSSMTVTYVICIYNFVELFPAATLRGHGTVLYLTFIPSKSRCHGKCGVEDQMQNVKHVVIK